MSAPVRRVITEMQYDDYRVWNGMKIEGWNANNFIDEIESYLLNIGLNGLRQLGLECPELPMWFKNEIRSLMVEINSMDFKAERDKIGTQVLGNQLMPTNDVPEAPMYVEKRYYTLPSNYEEINYDDEWEKRLNDKKMMFENLTFKNDVHELSLRDCSSENVIKWSVTCPVIDCDHQIPLFVQFEPSPHFRSDSYRIHLERHVIDNAKVN